MQQMATWEPVFPLLFLEWNAGETLKLTTRRGHRLRLRAYANEPHGRVEIEFFYVYGFQFHYGGELYRSDSGKANCDQFPWLKPGTVYQSKDTPALGCFRSKIEDAGENWSNEIKHFFVKLGNHWLEAMAIDCTMRMVD
jgi:hypothetical protein